MNLDVNQPYVLFLADIQASSKLKSEVREAVFQRIESENKRLNSSLMPSPVLNLSISYGDEVAGLFGDPRSLYGVADALRQAIYPSAFLRFVVVRNRIGVASTDIRQIGGPIFKRASEHMELLKRKNRFCSWDLGRRELDGSLEALVELSNGLIQRMTAYQREIWRLLRSGHSQKEIAKMLSKHQQSVSRAVIDGGAHLLLLAEKQIEMLLASL
jgi:hypothetical protein